MNTAYLEKTLYERCAFRIRQRKEQLRVTEEDIYPNNPTIISLIINNKRGKNNKYLITKGSLKNESDDGNTYGILSILNFSDEKEVCWGSEQEILALAPKIFYETIQELYYDRDISNRFIAYNFLCYYANFALYHTYLKYYETHPYSLSFEVGMALDLMYNNLDKSFNEAIEYIYSIAYIRNGFEDILLKYIDSNPSYFKFNKLFSSNFIEKSFIPFIVKNNPKEDSIGFRVRAMIKNDLFEVEKIIHEYKITGKITDDMKLKRKLVNASSNYVLKLIKIQKDKIESNI